MTDPIKKLGHSDNFRRTWNKEDYKSKPTFKPGKTKNEFSAHEITKKEKLKARDYLLNLKKNVGHSTVVKSTGGSTTCGGYFCDVCQCSINDSINFLDHINGKKHQKNLGMSMKVERSSLDQVKARIDAYKEKVPVTSETPKSFEERVEMAKQKDKEERKAKKEKKKLKKRQQTTDTEKLPLNEELEAIMGFGQFKGK